MSLFSTTSAQDSVEHSQPIPIGSAHSRRRSASISSSTSSGSPTSPIEPQTPLGNTTPPRMFPANLSPSKSPILSYFMSQPPAKSNTFPSFSNRGRFGGPPVFEEDEEDVETPIAAHARRASTAGTFGPSQGRPINDAQHERGTALLRRLSLGGAFARPPINTSEQRRMPSPPPNSAVTPPASNKVPGMSPKGTRTRRSATLNVDDRGHPRRAPSPMGERILKGHFDGFN
ncbi:hypothetical protein HWV62_22121 [Athelia sp. TMB]|nr:hypothetical protein HWV62_28755 [Athelia sp. TMB]KAF7971066.1 hypothetical protein HWV62_22121 [Athelia sp. TMB]